MSSYDYIPVSTYVAPGAYRAAAASTLAAPTAAVVSVPNEAPNHPVLTALLVLALLAVLVALGYWLVRYLMGHYNPNNCKPGLVCGAPGGKAPPAAASGARAAVGSRFQAPPPPPLQPAQAAVVGVTGFGSPVTTFGDSQMPRTPRTPRGSPARSAASPQPASFPAVSSASSPPPSNIPVFVAMGSDAGDMATI
ncbi:Hypothetical protein UVM_LOCUS445 [uncultured virus]|nr:Hypothetical protein UVM_LOCUS445 [uncultured virus]